MRIRSGLLLTLSLVLAGCSSTRSAETDLSSAGQPRLSIRGFDRTLSVPKILPLRVGLLIPEAVRDETAHSGSSRLPVLALGDALNDASLGFFGQVFAETFVVTSADDSRPRDVLIEPRVVVCKPSRVWNPISRTGFTCTVSLNMRVVVSGQALWDGEYTGDGFADLSALPFRGVRELKDACRRSVATAIRRAFTSASADLLQKPVLVQAFSAAAPYATESAGAESKQDSRLSASPR